MDINDRKRMNEILGCDQDVTFMSGSYIANADRCLHTCDKKLQSALAGFCHWAFDVFANSLINIYN